MPEGDEQPVGAAPTESPTFSSGSTSGFQVLFRYRGRVPFGDRSFCTCRVSPERGTRYLSQQVAVSIDRGQCSSAAAAEPRDLSGVLMPSVNQWAGRSVRNAEDKFSAKEQVFGAR